MSVSYGGDSITFGDGSIVSSGSQGFKNKIINGAMMIDQRNAGASYSAVDGGFSVDRWKVASFDSSAQTGKFTVQQSSTVPTGFSKSLLVTSSAATSLSSGAIYWIGQFIEGFNVADLDFGLATAKTVTLSFWVRSSLTGTFAGSILNNGNDRSYPFTYTINSANTFEYKTVTITGDTSGTWTRDSSIGLRVLFNLGQGSTYSTTANAWASGYYGSVTGTTNLLATNGATLYITGVQLEKGTTASTFEFRSYGKELMLCQRYYEKSYAPAVPVPTNASNNAYSGFPISGTVANGAVFGVVSFKVQKRADPTVVTYSYASSTVSVTTTYSGTDQAAGSGTVSVPNVNNFNVFNNSGGTITPTSGGFVVHWAASAEL
jgi:hypothetical protein